MLVHFLETFQGYLTVTQVLYVGVNGNALSTVYTIKAILTIGTPELSYN